MDSKRKLQTDEGFHFPNSKKERQHDLEVGYFDKTETPNFEFRDDIDPFALKSEVEFEEDQNFEIDRKRSQLIVTPQQEILPLNRNQIKIEQDDNLRYMKEEFVYNSDHSDNSCMVKKECDVCACSIDEPEFSLDLITGKLPMHSERPTDSQGSGARYEGGSKDSQPSRSKSWFEPQPNDQKPTSSHISAKQQVKCGATSLNSFDHMSPKLTDKAHPSSPSVSIKMLLDYPFNSGFWNADQLNRILTDPIPFFGDDGAKEVWLDQFSSYPWLCRSDELSRFFCWPCLLFGNPSTTWSTDCLLLMNFNSCSFTHLKDHQNTNQHQEAELIYIMKKNITHALKPEPNSPINQENWKRLVRVICSERKNKAVFENDIDFKAKIIPLMRYIFPKMINDTAAFHLSNVILAVATNYMEMKVISDVQKAQYVALHFEELSPVVRNGSWLVAIARYADQDGHTRERVIEFFKTFPVKARRSEDESVAWIKHLFEDYKLNLNVIGISYSATLVAPTNIFLFSNRLMKWCPRALFFHPPAHSFYKSLLQAMSHSSTFCCKYLQELHKICKFLTKYATMFLLEQSTSSALPKTFDADFQAKFKSYYPVLNTVFRRVETSLSYPEETRKEASMCLKFLNTRENRMSIIIMDRVCSSLAKIAEAVDGTFHGLNSSSKDLTNLRLQSLEDLDNIIANGIRYIAEDELLAEQIPEHLHKKYKKQLKTSVNLAKAFLMQRFEKFDQFKYTNSKLLEYPLHDWKIHDLPLKQLNLDESESIQLKSFLNAHSGAPLTSISLTEMLTCMVRDKRQRELPGPFKFLQFLHTIACDKRTFGNLLNSIYSFTDIKSPEDLTRAYLDGYFWQVEDISAVMNDPTFYQTALEACQSKISEM